MRWVVLCLSSLLLSCAPTVIEARSDTSHLAISLSRGALHNQTALIVTIVNRSSSSVCLTAETLEEPYSYEMHLSLRDAHGRPVAYHKTDLIVPPRPGIVRIGPGESISRSYFIESRFEMPGGGKSLPPGFSAQAEFRYGICEDAISLKAISSWQVV